MKPPIAEPHRGGELSSPRKGTKFSIVNVVCGLMVALGAVNSIGNVLWFYWQGANFISLAGVRFLLMDPNIVIGDLLILLGSSGIIWRARS